MPNFDSVIREMIQKRKETLSSIDNEKEKQVLPYGYRPALRETFEEIYKKGAEVAGAVSRRTLNKVYKKIGFIQ